MNPESADGETGATGRISPTAFMRKLRPEFYSDTKERTHHTLKSEVLGYHLQQITALNQTHDFEIFCRKLCERAICPNLRPATGPEGGGDSKADTETYAVSDEIMQLHYIATANSGKERWAFAFSAKARWGEKARKDVEGIVGTNRSYDRIVFITSQPARAKDRARIEDELTRKYGTPVTIHDRSWIVSEIIDKERIDLAVDYLKIGEATPDRSRMGPADYARAQRLEDIERAITDPEAFRGMEMQRVSEALLAAKLSRGLERPRIETDGRFDRAVRLADADGSYRQQLEARYEQIWTALWWYDDFPTLLKSYDDFQAFALKAETTAGLEWLGNIHQLLVNAVVHGHLTAEATQVTQRASVLRDALDTMSRDTLRPNSSLEAHAGLLRVALNNALLAGDRTRLPTIWTGYEAILDKARGLGEFDAEALTKYIDAAGEAAGNDRDYNRLIDKLAAFVGERKSEGEGGLILLSRAKKLGLADKLEMIRLLGNAAVMLSKREYADAAIEAAQLLALAYRSAGLLWASRSSCALAASSILIAGEGQPEIDVTIVPTTKMWAWVLLELGHIPDFIHAVQILRSCAERLPLDEDSKAKVTRDLQQLDMAFGCVLLNLEARELEALTALPDILDALDLVTARACLLLMLGYMDILHEDGSIPAGQSAADIDTMFGRLKGQAIANQLTKRVVLNAAGPQTYHTKVLGMKIDVTLENENSILLAEIVMGSLEAFFATMIAGSVAPHTERYGISVLVEFGLEAPRIDTDKLSLSSTIHWPEAYLPLRQERQREMCDFLIMVASHVMATGCMLHDAETLAESLARKEAVLQRVSLVIASVASYNRALSRDFARLSDFQHIVLRTYERKASMQFLADGHAAPGQTQDDDDEDDWHITDYRRLIVRSVIDVHLWEKAGWRGAGYLQSPDGGLPSIALLFEDASAARHIFVRWRERFGEEDGPDGLAVSIIRELPGLNPHHYMMQIAPGGRLREIAGGAKQMAIGSRAMTMEPGNSRNLEVFLDAYSRSKAYFLVPGVNGFSCPQFMWDVALAKRDLTIVAASAVTGNDVQVFALRSGRTR